MRALTLPLPSHVAVGNFPSNNEILAREGIDTDFGLADSTANAAA